MKSNNNLIGKMFIFMIAIVLLNLSISVIYADTKNVKANLYSNETNLVSDQEFDVILKFSDYKAIDKGLNAYKAKLVYDESVFEKVDQSNFSSLNNWEKLQYNADTGEFVSIKKSGSKSPEEVVKIRLKTKSDISDGKTIVKVNEIVTSEGKKDIFINNEIISINLIGNKNNNPVEPTTPNNPIKPGTSESQVPSSSAGFVPSRVSESNSNTTVVGSEGTDASDETNSELDSRVSSEDGAQVEEGTKKKKFEDTSESDEKISKTNNDYLLVFAIIIGGIGFLILFIIKDSKDDKNNDKDDKNNISKTMMFILIGILSLQFVGTAEAAFYDFSNKGEVTGDGEVNYDDVNHLELHLINRKKLENKYLENADMNSDGYITVTDLTLLVQKIEKTLDYEVELSKTEQDNKYVSKNDDFELLFKAKASYGARVQKVKINDIYYDVVLVDNEKDIYKVIVNSSNQSGSKEYKFSEVLLNNDKKISVNFTETIEVLKTKPVISNYTVTDDINNSTMDISFDLDDNDNSVISSNIQIVDKDGTVIKESKIKKGHNFINVKVDEDKIYNCNFVLNYNLTTDKNVEDSTGELVGSVNLIKEFQLVGDYKFSAGNFESSNGAEFTTIFNKGQSIKLFFESDNVTKYVPERIKINGKNYDVSLEGSKYAVIIPGFDKFGSNSINIESIILSNGKTFDIKDNNVIEVSIVKMVPSVSNFTVEEKEDNVIDVDFKVNNTDNALSSMIINLLDENDKLLEQTKLSAAELKGSNSINRKFRTDNLTSKYKISVVASYSLTGNDKDIKENEILYQKEFIKSFKVSVQESNSNKSYYEKGEDVLLTYKIVTNCIHDVEKLRINNKDYIVTKIDKDLYQVAYKAPTNSGVVTLNLSKVVCSGGSVSSVSNITSFEVLKDAPRVDNYTQKFNSNKSKVSIDFSLVDKEKSFVDGNVSLVNKNGVVLSTKKVNLGKNSVDFDLEAFNSYTLKVNVTYDRDSKNDSINKISKDLIIKNIESSTDYNLEVTNLKTFKGTEESKYFEKSEKVKVSFNAKNARNADVVEVTINGKKYSVVKSSNTYQAVVDGYSKSGEQALTIEKVKLANGVELEVESDNKVQIEILKDVPTVTNYQSNIDLVNSKAIIKFSLNDNENSLVSAEAVISDKAGKVVSKKTVVKGKNTLEFTISKNNSYTLNINATYDRDNKNDDVNKFENKTILSKDVNDDTDYSVTVTEIKAFKNNKETKYFEKNEKIQLNLKGKSNSNLDFNEVTINGKKYSVVKSGDVYQIVVDGYEKPGVQTLTLEKVKLVNSVELDVKSNNKIQIEILKNVPTVTNYQRNIDPANSKAVIKFNLNDNEDSLISAEAVLSDKDGKEVSKKTVVKGQNTLEFNIKRDNSYTLNVNVTYDRDSKNDNINKFENKTLLSKEIKDDTDYSIAISEIKSIKDNVENNYFEKDEKIQLNLTGKSNSNLDFKEVTVNGKKYSLVKSGDVYQVLVDGYANSGEQTLIIEKIKLTNDVELEIKSNNKVNIEILKDAPSISGYKQTIDNSKAKVEFNLNDKDKSLVSAEAVLYDEDGAVVSKKTVTSGKNSLEFTIQKSVLYAFKVNATYDRDVKNDNINKIKDKVLITKEIIDNTDYKVAIINFKAIKDNKDAKYFEKNEKINIVFQGENVSKIDVSEITVNGKKYSVVKSEDIYHVELDGYANSGEQTLTIEKIKLTNNIEMDVTENNKTKVEVLKTKPVINNYNVLKNINDSSLEISFDLVDSDNASINSTLQIFDDKNKVVKEFTIKKGANKFKLTVDEGKDYKANFAVDYNLSLDAKETDKNIVGTLKLEKTLRLDIDYNFVANNFKVYNDKNEEISIFNKGKEIKLVFESFNATTNIPNKIRINGEDYNVKLENEKYNVVIPGFESFGSNKINIEKVTLSNGKSFDVKQSLDISIIKNVPTINDLSIVDKGERVRIDFSIDDEDKALLDLEIVLYNDKDEIIKKEKLSSGEIEAKDITKLYTGVYTATYKVKVVSNYLLTDNTSDKKENIVLSEKEIEATAKVNNIIAESDKRYYEKGSNAILTYDIATNSSVGIKNFTINDKNYVAIKLEDGRYQINYKLDSSCGVKTLKLTNVTFNNNEIVRADNTLRVEILKDAVSIDNFKQIDNINDSKVTLNFDVNDLDSSFISGEAILTARDSGASISKDIIKGKNSLVFDVEESKVYRLDVVANYDRDSNTLTTDVSDNLFENSNIFTQGIQLVIDYNLNTSDLGTYKNNQNSKYFAKDEKITLRFKSNNSTEFDVTDVRVNGSKYSVVKNSDGFYQTEVDGYSSSGVKKLILEKVKLSNSKEFTIFNNNEVQVEILKDCPSVKNYSYEESAQGDVTFSFDLVDQENAISDASMFVLEEGNVIRERKITVGHNSIAFSPKEDMSYALRVTADYDLDSNKLDNNSNSYKDAVLFENEISLGKRHLQVKDIVSAVVYTQTSDGVKGLDNVNVSDLSNLDNFIVKVSPKDMPSFYTTIESYRVVDNRLKLTLKYDDIVQYEGNKKLNKLEVDAGKVNNGSIVDDSLENLVKKINANPNGNFELTKDYDASLVSPNLSTVVTEKFTGTLNGNGHKIINLNKPLFNELEGATIKNIVFNNVKLSGASSHGTVANVVTDTTVTNVHIKGLNYTTGANHSAGMIGEATNTNVSECSVTDFIITTAGHARVSAIIGKLTDGSIRNCYVEGDINSTQSKDGNGIGGVLGHGFGVEIVENCITKIKISNNQGARLNGAVVGLFMNRASVLKNNVSLSTGQNFYSVYGNGGTVTATNNYELADSGLVSNAAALKFSSVTKNQINSLFYKNDVKFDDTIWNLSSTSYDKLPRLKNSDPNGSSASSDTDSGGIYIPDYDRIKKVTGYKKSSEKLYHNIYKLMPYYDAKFLIEDSLKIASDNVLATKLIKHILPYSEGKLLTYITVENYNTISDIKVVFDDMTVSNYKVNFKELNQNISIYEIEELGIDYAPDSYIMRNDSAIVNVLKAYIDGIDYNTTLEPLTEAADARHYRDNFNGVVKGISLDLSLKLLANYGDAITVNSEILNNKIKAELIDSGIINKYIYGYNYFNRWYDFEIGGSKVSDLLLFETKMFKEDNNLNDIMGEVLVGNIAVGSTDGFFNSNVAKYTGSSRLQYFLDYLITNIGGYEDVNDWFTEYFGSRNFLAEFGVDNRPELLYRGWYQLKKNSRMILPVITMPSDSTYMISGPAQLQFGPAQLYNKDTVTDAGKKVVRDTINNHVTLAKRHFTVLAGSFGSLKWNNYCIMVYDCTKIITGYREGYITIGGVKIPTGKIVPVYTQGRVGLNYAFFKNFSEVLGLWQPAGSSGGVGNTAGFLWFQAQPGLTNFDTWTHEFEHALSDKIMLDQRGFRTRMEIMTQGNVEQRDDWSINNLNQDVGPGYFNTSFYLNKEGNATQNLSPDRIDTKEEMENYFKGQQNALDLLDYIEGKAFIRLTPEQQAKIATKVTSASERTAWGTITADQATQMNLTSLESLYDNQIILRPLNAWGASVRGLTAPTSTVADNYGYESVWVNRWYIDHYDSRFSGAFGTKRNFFEMLGYAGVEGYIIYGSGSRNAIGDLNVIQRITKLVTGTAMNWREYKMSRYATVEENLNNNKYIDAEYMIQRFTEALINDANNGDKNVSQRTNLRKIYYHYLKSATNDFIDDPLGTTVEVNHIKTADELVQKINSQPYGYYVLDNDIDFTNMTKNVTQTFMGRLDGNGYKIIGNKFPIFNKIRYGYVGNIVFENTNIPKNLTTAGALSYRAEMSTVEKIIAKNIQMNFAGRNDLSLIGGAVSNVVTRDCSVEKLTHHISSIDDIAMLNEDTTGIFIVDNDIDFADKTYNGSVVTNTFTGKIDGNGHTFSNLTNASLFANFNGTVENLNINNFSIQSTDSNIGSFAKQTSGATLRNMKFTNITMNGASNLGAVVGTDNRGSVFEKMSVKNFSLTSTGMFVGGIAGSQYGGRVSNVVVEGEINIAHIGAGGIIGATGNGTAVNINNVISNVKINRTGDTDTQHRKNNAGVVGFIADVSKLASITNSIALGDMQGFTEEMLPNKFVYTTEDVITAKLTKCYELSEVSGLSGVTNNTAGHLDVVGRKNLNVDFYKSLGYDELIWNFDTVSTKGYPTLR